MTQSTRTYAISLDMPGGICRNLTKLKAELAAPNNDIFTKVNLIVTNGDSLNIVFDNTLSAGEITALDGGTGQPYSTHPAGGLLAAHDDTPSIETGEGGFAAPGALKGIAPTSSGQSFGYIGTNATSSVTVRATTYTPQTNEAQRSISSSSASDTSAGTGARQVKITYYDATLAGPSTETVTLNGTTAVNTVQTNIAFIEKLEVVSAGSGGGNVGAITLYIGTGGGGGGFASFAAGDNMTYWAHHHVPTNVTCYITQIFGSAAIIAGGITINTANPISGNTIPQISPDITMRYSSSEVLRHYATPLAIVGPVIIWLNTRPDSSTASTTFAGFHWAQI